MSSSWHIPTLLANTNIDNVNKWQNKLLQFPICCDKNSTHVPLYQFVLIDCSCWAAESVEARKNKSHLPITCR